MDSIEVLSKKLIILKLFVDSFKFNFKFKFAPPFAYRPAALLPAADPEARALDTWGASATKDRTGQGRTTRAWPGTRPSRAPRSGARAEENLSRKVSAAAPGLCARSRAKKERVGRGRGREGTGVRTATSRNLQLEWDDGGRDARG